MKIEAIIRNYFQAWIDKNSEVIQETFADDIVYSECYGPEYHGIEQILKWFKDWNVTGSVLRWDIKQINLLDKTAFVEWYFECDCDNSRTLLSVWRVVSTEWCLHGGIKE